MSICGNIGYWLLLCRNMWRTAEAFAPHPSHAPHHHQTDTAPSPWKPRSVSWWGVAPSIRHHRGDGPPWRRGWASGDGIVPPRCSWRASCRLQVVAAVGSCLNLVAAVGSGAPPPPRPRPRSACWGRRGGAMRGRGGKSGLRVKRTQEKTVSTLTSKWWFPMRHMHITYCTHASAQILTGLAAKGLKVFLKFAIDQQCLTENVEIACKKNYFGIYYPFVFVF